MIALAVVRASCVEGVSSCSDTVSVDATPAVVLTLAIAALAVVGVVLWRRRRR
ncbi:MAG: hypothetical protein QM677_09440 [Microbacterium sp.]